LAERSRDREGMEGSSSKEKRIGGNGEENKPMTDASS